MRTILLGVLTALFICMAPALAQEQVWPVLANGATLASDPIRGQALVSQGAGGPSVVQAAQNNVIPSGTSISGALTGDLGQPTPGAQSLLSFACTTTPPTLISYSTYAPGIHVVTASLTVCSGFSAGSTYSGSLEIVIPPSAPQTSSSTCVPNLIDPIQSNLFSGSAITGYLPLLASSSNITVLGASADGVTQLLLAIPANHVGDNIELNLFNDASQPSTSTAQDGGLMQIGGNPSQLAGTLNLVAQNPGTGQGMAFAVYVTPTDYARSAQNFPQDNTSVQRQVSLQVYCPAPNGSIPATPSATPVTITRPPLVLLHGIWSDRSAWDNFSPSGSSEAMLWGLMPVGAARYTIDYGGQVAITSPTPTYGPQITSVTGSAMGFAYNAQMVVLPRVRDAIGTFSAVLDVASVQADIIAHSMGGNITRYMPLLDTPNQTPVDPPTLPFFLTDNTYGKGPIEKLITIGTPHLGTPLATSLLPQGSVDLNGCVRRGLAGKADITLQTATVAGNLWAGGVGDLAGDGQDTNGASAALRAIQDAQGMQPFPMAYIAGTENSANLAGLSCTYCAASVLRSACGTLFGNDPLANDLTPSNWPTIFGGGPNDGVSDGIVSLTSQLNGNASGGTPGGGGPVTFVIHSGGLLALDFLGPTELSSGVVATYAIDLLNEPKTGQDFEY